MWDAAMVEIIQNHPKSLLSSVWINLPILIYFWYVASVKKFVKVAKDRRETEGSGVTNSVSFDFDLKLTLISSLDYTSLVSENYYIIYGWYDQEVSWKQEVPSHFGSFCLMFAFGMLCCWFSWFTGRNFPNN